MRHIIFCIALAAALLSGTPCGFRAAAQFAPAVSGESKTPISWRGTARMTGDGEGVIRLIATMEQGWHLYGTTVPKDGPRPTEFKFDTVKGMSLSGSVNADKAPLRKLDGMFNAEVEYWEGKVVFTQKFKLDKKSQGINSIKCSVSYMGCNDQTCLPPKTKDFTFKILPKK